MKSRIISLCNYVDLVSEPLITEVGMEDLRNEVELELQKLRFKCKRQIPVDTVAEGDVATLTLQSGLQKMNRSGIPLNVGTGLFSKELEHTLPGRRVGETYITQAEGAEVTVTVNRCLRTEIPEITDELIRELGINGVSSVEQYKAQIEQQSREMYHGFYVEWYAMQLLNRWCEKSTFEIDEQEFAEWLERWKTVQQEEMDFHQTKMMESYPGQLNEMYREEVTQLIHTVLLDSYFQGRDYRTVELELSKEAISQKQKRVMAPLINYLKPLVRFEWKEDV